MADDSNPAVQTDDSQVQVVIPEETKKRFPDLVKMILESKSMNNQERNYWLQVLPVMTEPQVAELRDILETEKRKLAEIEAKYAAKPEEKKISPEEIEAMNKKKEEERLKRKQEEAAHREEENPDDLLSMLDDL